jgi:hypothetical protein
MVVFTIKARKAASKRFPELSCPVCGTSGGIEITVLQQQVNLGFIPMLPTRKVGRVQCSRCGGPVTLQLGGERFQAAFKAFKWTVRAPLRLYTGVLAGLALLLVLSGAMAYQDNHNPYAQPIEQAHLDAPRAGDLYEVRVNGAPGSLLGHTLVRVEEARGELIRLRWHRNLVPIQQPMPLLRDFPTTASDFEEGTMEVLASRLKRKFVVRQGVQDELADATGHVVATLRPRR